jgi:DNA-binding NarL/FixJ family response regulator
MSGLCSSEPFGYQPRHCVSALSAFAAASELPPQLVLVDATLPDMGLAAFIGRFQQLYPQSLILAMVDCQQGRDAAEAIQAAPSTICASRLMRPSWKTA